MRSISCVAIFLALAMSAAASAAEERGDSVAERNEQFLAAIDRSGGAKESERSERLAAEFDRLFAHDYGAGLTESSDGDLETLFLAALSATRLIGRESDLERAERIYAELVDRGQVSPTQLRYMHGTYVQARRMEDARALALAHPSEDLEAVPLILPYSGGSDLPTVLVHNKEDDILSRHPIALGAPSKIVVVAHPRCGFVRAALQAISQDSQLLRAFSEHAEWITIPDFTLDLEVLERLAETYPYAKFRPAYSTKEWPMIDYWGTPTFYFLQHGVVKAKVVGWPKDGRHRTEVLEALATLGL